MKRFLALSLLGILTAFPAARAQPMPVDVSSVERVRPDLPVIPKATFVLTDFGAIGDGATMNTSAFKDAIAAITKAGGGTLIVPKGVFRTAGFTLCSSLELHLEEGAVIQAPDTFEGLGMPDPSTFKTQEEVNATVKTPGPLISGKKLHDVAITGTGTIDGSGAHWWAWSERAAASRRRSRFRSI